MQIATRPHTECPDCGGRDFEKHESDGVVVCESCHAVVEERLIDHGPDWRSFEDGETDPERTGAPVTPTMHDRGMSTVIGYKKDGQGNQLSPSQRSRADRMRWIEEREGMGKHERTLRFAFGEIDRMTSALDLPDIVHEEGCRVFRRAKNEELLPGRSIEGVVAAIVALVAKDQKLFRSYEEIASIARVDVREIERSYLQVNRELGLEIEPVTPLNHFSQVLGRVDNVAEDGVGYRRQIEPVAREMLVAAQNENLHVGKRPAAFAAAAVYAASVYVFGDIPPVTQGEIAEVVDVSPPTLRTRYNEILEHWEEEKEECPANQPDLNAESDQQIAVGVC